MEETSIHGGKRKAITGSDEVSIDGKGRLLVSRKKRDRLGQEFVIAVSENGCLAAYPADVWDAIVDRCLSVDPINIGRQIFTREFLGHAEDEIKFDDQGRFVLPLRLRNLAKIKKEVVMIGCGDRMEIWAKEEHDLYTANPVGYGRERRELLQKADSLMKDREVQF